MVARCDVPLGSGGWVFCPQAREFLGEVWFLTKKKSTLNSNINLSILQDKLLSIATCACTRCHVLDSSLSSKIFWFDCFSEANCCITMILTHTNFAFLLCVRTLRRKDNQNLIKQPCFLWKPWGILWERFACYNGQRLERQLRLD